MTLIHSTLLCRYVFFLINRYLLRVVVFSLTIICVALSDGSDAKTLILGSCFESTVHYCLHIAVIEMDYFRERQRA